MRAHELGVTLFDTADVYGFGRSERLLGRFLQYLASAVDVMRELREHGMIRAIGMRAPHTFAEEWATGAGLRAIETAQWLHLFHQIQPDVVTVRYNLLSPTTRGRPTSSPSPATTMSAY